MSRRAHPSDDDLELAEQLRAAIGRLVRGTRARADAMPRARAELLGRLDRDGAQTIAELAAGRSVRHQAMSRAVKDVEALGLVTRAADPRDARAQLIRITEAGTDALRRDREARRDVLSTAIREQLDDAERHTLQQVPGLLDKLSGADEPGAPYARVQTVDQGAPETRSSDVRPRP